MPTVRFFWIVTGTACLCGLIIYGLPILGLPSLASPDLRLRLLAVVLAIAVTSVALGFWLERMRANALEQGMLGGYAGHADPTGEARLVAVRMANVLAQMKRKGGRGYLYAQPWYVIIGPPGVGKTTALQHCGVPFQTIGTGGTAARGFGGTRNVDWWFSDRAVLLDTAGRYVTQESDRARDIAGWAELLRLLRTRRPRQPVNGVILAFSVEDLLFGTHDSLEWHAAVVRARLAEVQEVLDIDVPVYVIFTKVDLIAGFRERFDRLTPQDRQAVWGHTFQTRDPRDATATRVGQAFDGILDRLTSGTVTEIAMEPDGARRIAGFAFPTQMALLKPKAEMFLASAFAAPAGRTRHRAVLRGFYFASGTQEGTPFDQILGMLAHDRGAAMPRGDADGRRGKSYFLHDLLTRVVLAEQDWVGHDHRRGTWQRRLQRAGLAMVVAVVGATMVGVSISYWTSATRVAEVESAAAAYLAEARTALTDPVVADDDPRPVLGFLDSLRALPGIDPAHARHWPRFGLDRHEVMAAAATQAYGDGLERLLRPRLMLSLENMLLRDLAIGPAHPDPGAVFQRLMAYLHLSNHPASSTDGDAAVLLVLTRQWRANGTDRSAAPLRTHVQAMFALDDGAKVAVSADAALVAGVRALLENLPLAAQVLALLDIRSFADGLGDLVFVDDMGEAADLFRTTDGTSLASVVVPGLFTDAGARQVLPGATGDAAEVWRAGRWVMGDGGVPASVVEQLAGLDAAVLTAYRDAAVRAWASLFQTLALQPVTPDMRGVKRLERLGDPAASPMRRIASMAAAAPAGTHDPMLWQQFALTGPDAVTEAIGRLAQSMRTALQSPSSAADAVLSRDLERLTVAASGAPPILARMVAGTVATIRAPDPATAIADLQRAFEAELDGPCHVDLAGRFPFAAPDAPEAVPVPVFAEYFGPGGRVDTFIARHLAGHVIDTADGLRPDMGGHIAAGVDPGILGFVNRARAIQGAFFMDDGSGPVVAFALGLVDAPPDVAQVVVTLHGTTVVLRPGDAAVPIVWNGASEGLSIELLDPQGAFLGGFDSVRDGWDAVRWVSGSARGNVDAATVELRTEITGRMLGLHAVFESRSASFGMTALREWRCPRALE